jgi:DNA-directed RNA polymerase specialized sigma24 family protein
MVEKRCQNSPENNDLDRRLQELALEAQKHPHQSPQRQVALNRLWELIWQSNRLGHPQQGRWTSSIYEDLYNEAIARTCLEICQKIDRYNPEYPVMMWVNYCLKFNFKQVAKDCYKHTFQPSLDDLDLDIRVDETPSEAQALRKFLEEDPEGLLKAESLQKRADVTFQFLVLEKYVKDRTWESIANELDIPFSTLNNFFDRRLRKLKPYFLKYLAE